MTNIYQHINIILICSNIVGLTFFCHFASDRDTSLPFLLPFLIAFAPLTKHSYMIRGLYCVIAVLSILSVFVSHTLASVLIASCSLGLSLNLGYYLTNQIRFFSSELVVRIYEGAISLSIASGILLSTGASSLNFSLISGKILVLVTTVANFYLPTGTPRLH